jgi:hypothetical protein
VEEAAAGVDGSGVEETSSTTTGKKKDTKLEHITKCTNKTPFTRCDEVATWSRNTILLSFFLFSQFCFQIFSTFLENRINFTNFSHFTEFYIFETCSNMSDCCTLGTRSLAVLAIS